MTEAGATRGVAVLVAAIYGLLSAVHLFWLARGRVGGSAAIPSVGGRPVFAPSRAATLAVALALAAAALVVLAQGGLLLRAAPAALVRVAAAVLGVVFLLRAVGDFRLVGFFKTVRDSRFATYDTRLFSPLCLALGAAVLWLARAPR